MNDLELIAEYEQKLRAYNLAFGTIYFDNDTVAPKDGLAYRFACIDVLNKEYYNIKTDEKVYEALLRLSKEKLDSINARRVKLLLKDFVETKKIPEDVYLAFSKLQNEAQQKWEEAKNTNNYALYEPYLIRIIEMTKELCKYRNSDMDAYELLLDDYEEGMDSQKYDEFFDLVKKELVPLIAKINDKQDEVSDACISGNFDVQKQKEFTDILAKFLGFDSTWGYISEYMHPYTNALGIDDVRVTTFYREDNLVDSMFSTIHEVGHGTYEHQMDREHDSIVLRNVSSGLHESQSRLFENYLARNSHFWDTLYPQLQDMYSEQLKNVTQEEFIRAINKTSCSLIRTMADELTYPIHILIRYEMEKAIFNGTLALKDLNKVWNKYYKEYLGVDVDSDTNGILQDVHWSGGSFGYFPTYALGSAYAAQFLHHMRKELDVDKLLSEGNMHTINEWLKEHIHVLQSNVEPSEVIKRATGEMFNPRYYIDYLKDKYSKLYNVG